MACATFRGLMSCACRQQCEKRFGGVARRHAPLCWDWKVSDDRPIPLNLSDLPDVPSAALAFRTPSWPPIGRCAKPNPPRHCAAGQGTLHAPRGQHPRRLATAQLALSARVLVAWRASSRPAAAETAQERFPLGGGGDWSGWSKGSGAGARARVGKGRGGEGVVERSRRSGPSLCICHTGYSGAGCETCRCLALLQSVLGPWPVASADSACANEAGSVDCSLRNRGDRVAGQGLRRLRDHQNEGGVRGEGPPGGRSGATMRRVGALCRQSCGAPAAQAGRFGRSRRACLPASRRSRLCADLRVPTADGDVDGGCLPARPESARSVLRQPDVPRAAAC